jgi:hypothetical protein
MSSNRKTAPVSVIGIDIGKNSFHVVGQDQRGAIVLRQKWSRGQVETRRQHTAVSDRHGGLRRRAPPQPEAADARARRADDAGEVCPSLFERAEERLPPFPHSGIP